MSIRHFVISRISPVQKQQLQSFLLNMRRFLCFKGRIRTDYEYITIGKGSKHSFFGYYDITPFNNQGELVFLQLEEKLNSVSIILYNRISQSKKVLTNSKAWNWQQGSRLRWYKNDNTIIFNDFNGENYFSREFNIRTNKEKRYCLPLYDINFNGTLGLSLNFERLGEKRPGYGYVCVPYKEPQYLGGEGIDLVDLSTDTFKRIITYNDIADVLGSKNGDFSNNYINHLSFSPSGEKFMFFWLTIVGSYHKAYMLVYNLKTGKILPLETEGKVSHYLWLDEEHLLCTVYDEKQVCRYVIYGLDGSKKHVFKSIDYDGHPIWYKEGLILTDSYPDKKSYQRLMVCNLDTDETKQILEIFQEPAISVECRTDLHPRYDTITDTICIDASPRGTRELLLINTTNK